MTIDKATVDVSSAQCTCPAGKGPFGSCKHIAALCFALEDFAKMREIILEQGEEACTSVLQRWNQPRKKRLESKRLKILIFLPHVMAKAAPVEPIIRQVIPDQSICRRQAKVN